MFCPNCGNQIDDDDVKFCPFCGAKIEAPEEPEETESEQTEPAGYRQEDYGRQDQTQPDYTQQADNQQDYSQQDYNQQQDYSQQDYTQQTDNRQQDYTQQSDYGQQDYTQQPGYGQQQDYSHQQDYTQQQSYSQQNYTQQQDYGQQQDYTQQDYGQQQNYSQPSRGKKKDNRGQDEYRQVEFRQNDQQGFGQDDRGGQGGRQGGQGGSKKTMVVLIAVIVGLIAVIGIIFALWKAGILGAKKSTPAAANTTENTAEAANTANTAADNAAASTTGNTTGNTTTGDVLRDKPIRLAMSVSASSTDTADGFSTDALTDQDAGTAWAENVAGTGTNEYVTLKLQTAADVYGIAILPGWMGSQDAYDKTSCPTAVTVTAGDYQANISLSNFTPDFSNPGQSMLFCDFSKAVHTDEIVVKIADTHMGTRDITCISELAVYTYPTAKDEAEYNASLWTLKQSDVSGSALLADSSAAQTTTQPGTDTETTAEGDTKKYAGAEIHVDADGYVLASSGTKYLSDSDLAGMSAQELKLARNEIYARHGRKFKDAGLQAYFNSCDWYSGTISPDSFQESLLNKYEKKNKDVITAYEKKMGYR